jgi:hypothetical protein
MKSLISAIILAAVYLTAGANAGHNPNAKISAPAVTVKLNNVTVISKNQAWPIQPDTLFTTCEVNKCFEV